jgi:hypothetical protein
MAGFTFRLELARDTRRPAEARRCRSKLERWRHDPAGDEDASRCRGPRRRRRPASVLVFEHAEFWLSGVCRRGSRRNAADWKRSRWKHVVRRLGQGSARGRSGASPS